MTMFKAAATALMLSLSATVASADLSAADIAAVDGKSGIRVYTADGDFLGVSNGIRVGSRNTKLFLFNRSGSIFRFRGRDVVVTTPADQLTLRGNDLFLEASTQRVRNKAFKPASDSAGPITIFLPRR
ncbi:hypothetical protein [Tateyamaria sp. SN6-1]|uniref:hypothetical protein n=1 Tax=Tateyamaria sp. SN6-1 TaxID=3092148 RepID=UPI0039F5FE58